MQLPPTKAISGGHGPSATARPIDTALDAGVRGEATIAIITSGAGARPTAVNAITPASHAQRSAPDTGDASSSRDLTRSL